MKKKKTRSKQRSHPEAAANQQRERSDSSATSVVAPAAGEGPSPNGEDLLQSHASARFDREVALTWLRILSRKTEVLEVFVKEAQIPGLGRRQNLTGYYDQNNHERLVDDVLPYSGNARGIYVRINVLNPAVLARSQNRLQPTREVTASSDVDIDRRSLLYIDIDPVRTKGVSATDREKRRAQKTADRIRSYLDQKGWPPSALTDTGNGFGIFYAIDLPADDGGLVHRVLKVLAAMFGSEHAMIDTSVANPSRIARLPGTLNCKGSSAPDRPHRLCEIAEIPPGEWQPVRRSLLEELADEAPVADAAKPASKDLERTLTKARRYVSKLPPAVAGRRGHDRTFATACCLVAGFDLTEEEAWPLMLAYNQRCQPPWSEAELRHKLTQADQVTREGGQQRGYLLKGRLTSDQEFDGWQPLEGAQFHGWVPDFGAVGSTDILIPLEKFSRLSWSLWFDLFSVWQQAISHPLIADVSLRQLHFGGRWPRNWRRTIAKHRREQTLERTRHIFNCTTENCLLCGAGIRHAHFAMKLKGWGFIATTLDWQRESEDEAG